MGTVQVARIREQSFSPGSNGSVAHEGGYTVGELLGPQNFKSHIKIATCLRDILNLKSQETGFN
jgi:hypothetical protein